MSDHNIQTVAVRSSPGLCLHNKQERLALLNRRKQLMDLMTNAFKIQRHEKEKTQVLSRIEIKR